MTKRQFEKLCEKEPNEIDFEKLDKEVVIKLYKHFYDASQYWAEMYQDLANEDQKIFDKIEKLIKGEQE